MNQPLIVRNNDTAQVTFTDEAVAMKNAAWETAASITTVQNADEQTQAVAAQGQLARALKIIEEAREAAKRPLIDWGRKLDAAAKTFVAELKEEQLRLDRLVGDFQTLEQAKVRAAEHLRNQELTELEREREKALAGATTHDEIDAIQEHYNTLAQSLPGPVTPIRAQGQIVRKDWDIRVTNIWDLARAHPVCVKIEPRLTEIKELLNQGVKVSGVIAEQITKSTVRATREPKALEV